MNLQAEGSGAAATPERTRNPPPEPLYGGKASRRVTVRDIAAAKARGEKWPMLGAYDALTAPIFDEAALPGLPGGASAGRGPSPPPAPAAIAPGPPPGRGPGRPAVRLLPGVQPGRAGGGDPVPQGVRRPRHQAGRRAADRPPGRGPGGGRGAGHGPRGTDPAVGARVRRFPGPGPW